jgi:hypothetical protein
MDVPISTSTTVATRDELFSANEQLALAGFLAGYSGLTRDAYTLDLRQYVAWCTEDQLAVFGGASRRRRVLRPPPRVTGPGPGHDRATAVRRVLFLPLRRTGPHRHLAGGTCASTTPGLRVRGLPAWTATRSAPCS